MFHKAWENDIKMQEIIRQFVRQIEEDQKLSKNSKNAYKSDLNDLLEYVQSTSTKLQDINQSWTKNYLKHLEETNQERNSYNRRASTLRIFLRFLYTNKLVPTNYSLIVNNLSTFNKTKEDGLNSEDMKRIIEETKLKDDQRLILLLIGKIGLTATQIATLKTFQVDFEKKSINLSDTEKIHLSNKVFALLREYMLNTRSELSKSNNNLSLFLNEKGEELTEGDIYKLIKNLSCELKLEGKLTARNLKRSFDKKVDILSVQREILNIIGRNN